MTKANKRPSKSAKAARKLLSDSKLLADKAANTASSAQEFRSSQVTPRTSTAIKPRPDKKRG